MDSLSSNRKRELVTNVKCSEPVEEDGLWVGCRWPCSGSRAHGRNDGQLERGRGSLKG